MFVQLNKCVVVCGSDLKRGNSGDGCLTSSILLKYVRSKGHLFVLRWARVRRVARGECYFGVMYSEWYGVCDFVVLSVVEVCFHCLVLHIIVHLHISFYTSLVLSFSSSTSHILIHLLLTSS